MAGGLRERKKRRTRATIVARALELFADRGYDATTVADIAAAADIAPRTFFGYFASKEDVVFHDVDDVLVRFGARVAERQPGESAFDALRAWVVDWVADKGPDDEAQDRLRHRLVAETPALAARERQNSARFGAVLAEAVAADLGLPPDGLRPRLVAAAAVAALEALADSADEPALHDDPLAVLDEALTFLRAGLEALRRQGGAAGAPTG
jgi:AcrR family transcriptional regulator